MTGGVWSDLVGQDRGIEVLQRAVLDDRDGGHAMSHAWLITGPPGSGRSNAARAFAAALQCPDRGCGECRECRTTLSGAHPDVTLLRTEELSIGVDRVRELVRHAAMSPTVGRRQIIVIEDADRITDPGMAALLKSIEEPAARTVWMLCAPTPEDVLLTIRSRCRSLHLVTPDTASVAALLIRRDGIDEDLAWHAARVAQGHIGRAKRFATHDEARAARAAVLELPSRLTDVAACLEAAQSVIDVANEQAAAVSAELDEKELSDLTSTLGDGAKSRSASTRAAIRDLEASHKQRATRLVRDELDRVITELVTYYRDVLVLQTEGDGDEAERIINMDRLAELRERARSTPPERSLRCIDALLEAREQIMSNVAVSLAMEVMMIKLARG